MKLLATKDIHYGKDKVAKAGTVTPDLDAPTAAALIAGGYGDEYVEPETADGDEYVEPETADGDGEADGEAEGGL